MRWYMLEHSATTSLHIWSSACACDGFGRCGRIAKNLARVNFPSQNRNRIVELQNYNHMDNFLKSVNNKKKVPLGKFYPEDMCY